MGQLFVIAILIFASLMITCESSILTIYTWRSYIKTPVDLRETFQSDVKGMEALVSLTPDGQPAIGEDDSDYLVGSFIDEVIDYHNNLENEMPTKQVVFNFYETNDTTVVKKTVDLLEQKKNRINFPIWLRAAIATDVDECNDDYTVFPDAIGFVRQVTRLNNVVLGVRWVTCKRAGADQYLYRKNNTDDMLKLLKQAGVDSRKEQAVNIFIRGHYANRSRDNLMDLYKKLNETNPVTFTLYADEEYWFNETTDDPNSPKPPVDPANIPETRAFIDFVGVENIYLQVSPDVRAQLALTGLSNPRASISSASSIVQLNFLLLIAFIVIKFIEILTLH